MADKPCLHFRPDHNGECLNCDEWYDEHVRQPLDPVLQREYRYWREIFAHVADRSRYSERVSNRLAMHMTEFIWYALWRGREYGKAR